MLDSDAAGLEKHEHLRILHRSAVRLVRRYPSATTVGDHHRRKYGMVPEMIVLAFFHPGFRQVACCHRYLNEGYHISSDWFNVLKGSTGATC